MSPSTGRLSPPVLIELTELASRRSTEFHQSLDPFAEPPFPVSWAGEQVSRNWFDTAREFTGAGTINSKSGWPLDGQAS